jgi:TonB family C-terminal domain
MIFGLVLVLAATIGGATIAPPPCPPDPIGLGGCCRDAPQLLYRVDAPYLRVAERRRLRGIAIVEAIIDPSGRVCHVRLLRGLDPEFDREALVAVRQWKFRPARSHTGKAVTVAFNLTGPG